MSIRDVLHSERLLETRDTGKSSQPLTLEAKHQAKMREFQESSRSIHILEAELAAAKGPLACLTDPDGDEGRQISERIEGLQAKIRSLKTDEGRLEYFLDVGDLLFQYFDAQESLAAGVEVPTAIIRTPSNSVLSYFTAGGSSPPTPQKTATTPRASLIDSTDGLARDKMLEKYLAIVDPSAIKSGILPGSGIEPGWGSCTHCGVEMTFYQNEAKLGCPRCGREEFILVDSEKPSYKDPPREVTYFAYKKINHFNEWLAQFQAKENTDIPADVVQAVMSELKKERISDPKKVKKEKIREILQKLRLSKMYDHVQQIKNHIQHQMTNLTLSKEMEEKLQHMFKEIQPAFIKYCPKDRSNFLSYPYVLYKLCQLLEMDEFLPCFQLLKSREKLYQQDQVWQKICAEMGWQFIRSI